MDIQRIVRTVGTSAANTAQTVSAPTGVRREVYLIMVQYSAAPTHSGITVTFNNGAGSGYDEQLTASSANAQAFSYIPATPIPLLTDDAIDVLAPAGGVSITSAVSIYTKIAE